MQTYKGGLFKTATEHKEQTRYFSQQDLKELYSLPKDGFDVSPTQLQLVAEHEPTPAAQVEEDEPRRTGNKTYRRYGSSSTSTEHYVAGFEYAFNPKDVNLCKINASPRRDTKLTESDIKERINRLSQLLSNKATISRLPGRGEKLRSQITELTLLELENLTTPERTNQVIDLDDIISEIVTCIEA